jgi:sialate O-acetylesterase
MKTQLTFLIALLVSTCAGWLRADVTLAPLFTDHAVLQRGKPVPIWGRADAGERVTVSFLEQSVSTVTDLDGRWTVALAPLATLAQGRDLVVTGHNTVILHDVIVGEVWLCSGQSNMEMVLNEPNFQVFRVDHATEEVAGANFPLIRQFKIGPQVAERPVDTLSLTAPFDWPRSWADNRNLPQPEKRWPPTWIPCSPATAPAFTAVGYFFARDVFHRLGVPIGLINSTYGGTPVESWMSRAALASDPSFSIVDQRWRERVADYPRAQAAYDSYTAIKARAASGEPAAIEYVKSNRAVSQPNKPAGPWTPTGLFNGMIHPLAPYALRGFLWYQGEGNTNAHGTKEYHGFFAAMITSWRREFRQGDLSFFWVQLPGFKPGGDSAGQTWALLREGQNQTLSLPSTGQAVAIDIGDPTNIHPTNKQEVGRRLALIAQATVYGDNVLYSGPIFDHAEPAGSKIRVWFKPAGEALKAQPSLQSFEVAGLDRKFHAAAAQTEGETVVAQSFEVPAPIAVRYAWRNYPEEPNLYSKSGLPASPFRSDDWP